MTAANKLYYTLRIPADLPQDIPALDIGLFEAGFEPPSPDVVGDFQASAFTPYQKPAIGGAALPRLQWAIACKLTEDEAMQLAALYRWQQTRLGSKLDGRLEWIDRFEPTEPQPVAELTRDIVDAKTTGYGMVYGFLVVACLISRPSRQLVSKRRTTPMRLCSFSVLEVR